MAEQPSASQLDRSQKIPLLHRSLGLPLQLVARREVKRRKKRIVTREVASAEIRKVEMSYTVMDPSAGVTLHVSGSR